MTAISPPSRKARVRDDVAELPFKAKPNVEFEVLPAALVMELLEHPEVMENHCAELKSVGGIEALVVSHPLKPDRGSPWLYKMLDDVGGARVAYRIEEAFCSLVLPRT